MDTTSSESGAEQFKVSSETVKAHSWEDAYEHALEGLFEDVDHISLDDIIEIAFQKGIVDRLAPEDEEVKRLRLVQHRRVWQGTREENDLYARLYYAVEGSRESVADTMDHSWTNAAWLAYNKTMSRESLRERLFGTVADANDSVAQFLEVLKKRIEEEYKDKGGKLLFEVMPAGKKAAFRGIAVTIDGYNPDGTLRVTADDEDDHRALYAFNKGKGLTPEMFLSKDFIIQK